jgi:hypothetical protein
LRFFPTFFSFSILNTFVPPAHPSEHTHTHSLTHTHRSSTSLSDFQHNTEGLTLTNFLPWFYLSASRFGMFSAQEDGSRPLVTVFIKWRRGEGEVESRNGVSLQFSVWRHTCMLTSTHTVGLSLQCSAFLRRMRPWQPFWGRVTVTNTEQLSTARM